MEVLPAEGACRIGRVPRRAGGRLPWAEFARRFGEIREMGAGKRDREHPHRKPVSAAEMLFYRGFLAKAFFDTDKGAQEFAYVPDDLLEIFKVHEGTGKHLEPLGRPATPVEKAFEIPATDHILDDATTLLAALRMGKAGYQPDPKLARPSPNRKTAQEKRSAGRGGQRLPRSPACAGAVPAGGSVEIIHDI